MKNKLRTIELTAKKEVLDYFAGAYHSIFKGQGLDIDEIREYVPGDDVRNIAWKKTAQYSKPFVKTFIEERDLTVLLLVDSSSSLLFQGTSGQKREYVATAASLIIFSAISNNDRVGALFFGKEVQRYVPPKRGNKHGMRLIADIMQGTEISEGTNIQFALETATKLVRKRAIIFVLSDFFSPEFEKALTIAATKHDVILMRVTDPLEETLPLGLLRLRDLETGRERVVDITPAYQAACKQHQTEMLRQLKELAGKSHASLIDLSTNMNCYAILRRFFAERKRRR